MTEIVVALLMFLNGNMIVVKRSDNGVVKLYDNYELLFYSNIIYTFNIISIIWGTKLWMKDFVKNVITYVTV